MACAFLGGRPSGLVQLLFYSDVLGPVLSYYKKRLNGASYLLYELVFNAYVFLRDRERQSTSGGGAERERETQNLKQSSEPSAQSPTQGSNPQTVRS